MNVALVDAVIIGVVEAYVFLIWPEVNTVFEAGDFQDQTICNRDHHESQ